MASNVNDLFSSIFSMCLMIAVFCVVGGTYTRPALVDENEGENELFSDQDVQVLRSRISILHHFDHFPQFKDRRIPTTTEETTTETPPPEETTTPEPTTTEATTTRRKRRKKVKPTTTTIILTTTIQPSTTTSTAEPSTEEVTTEIPTLRPHKFRKPPATITTTATITIAPATTKLSRATVPTTTEPVVVKVFCIALSKYLEQCPIVTKDVVKSVPNGKNTNYHVSNAAVGPSGVGSGGHGMGGSGHSRSHGKG